MSSPIVNPGPSDMRWRVSVDKSKDTLCVDLVDFVDAVELCLILTEAGHDPDLYRLDAEGETCFFARWELIKDSD